MMLFGAIWGQLGMTWGYLKLSGGATWYCMVLSRAVWGHVWPTGATCGDLGYIGLSGDFWGFDPQPTHQPNQPTPPPTLGLCEAVLGSSGVTWGYLVLSRAIWG